MRERYPRFADALTDLDDALTLIYLFAALPSEAGIKSKVTNKAKSLAAAWGTYCATTSSITKSFISVKGVYMESTIQGCTIRWVIPHSFTQSMPADVDYKVMLTFFEFYDTLLSFVMFKLFNGIGVRYPLPLTAVGAEAKGSASAILSSNLQALTSALNSSSGAVSGVVAETIEKGTEDAENDGATKKSKGAKKKSKELVKSVGAALNSLREDDSEEEDDDDDGNGDVDIAAPLKAALESMAEEEQRTALLGDAVAGAAMDEDAIKRRRLFAGLTFFLSREIPRGYLELVCLSYGGRVGWEGPNSSIAASDPSITHHIVDRPMLPSSYDPLPKSREFVQPQWIIDCTNFLFLLPVAKYGVGATLPPHLSPWVDDEEEGYKPAYADEVERLKNGELLEDIEEETTSVASEEIDAASASEQESEDEEEEEDDDDEIKERQAKRKIEEVSCSEPRARGAFDCWLLTFCFHFFQEKEAHDLAKVMMSKKATRLYGRMQNGLSQKQSKVELLQKRREDIDARSKRNDTDGKTPLKQKVERLKKERKSVEDQYSNTGGTMKKRKFRKSS